MGLLFALIRMVGHSAGKILSAAFGWSVNALFGQVSSRERLLLSGMVAAAAAWPILVLGVFLPRISAFVLAIVPLPKSIPHWPLRVLWIALAVLVPVALGWTMSKRSRHPAGTHRWQTFLRGFPMTLGLSSSFLVTLFVTPLMRVYWATKRWSNESAALTTTAGTYHQTAALVARSLQRHGVAVERAQAPGWMTLPTRLLKWLGGHAFHQLVPEEPEYWAMDGFFFTLYPNAVMFCGEPHRVAHAHGLVLEGVAQSGALQTYDQAAQRFEGRLIRLFRSYGRSHGPRSRAALRRRFEALCQKLGQLQVPFDEWQVLYRRALQFSQLFNDGRLLLDKVSGIQEGGAGEKAIQAASATVFAAFVGSAMGGLRARGGQAAP